MFIAKLNCPSLPSLSVSLTIASPRYMYYFIVPFLITSLFFSFYHFFSFQTLNIFCRPNSYIYLWESLWFWITYNYILRSSHIWVLCNVRIPGENIWLYSVYELRKTRIFFFFFLRWLIYIVFKFYFNVVVDIIKRL